MPTAFCESCQQASSWRNTRGAKLSNLRCPRCGKGPLVAAAYDYATGSWIKRTAKPRKPQGPLVCCVLCGRRGRQFGPHFPRDRRGLKISDCSRAGYGDKIEQITERTPVCWYHWEAMGVELDLTYPRPVYADDGAIQGQLVAPGVYVDQKEASK